MVITTYSNYHELWNHLESDHFLETVGSPYLQGTKNIKKLSSHDLLLHVHC